MEKSAPTRLNLLVLKSRHEVVKKGLDLLRSKREALMKEFFGLVDECVEMRERLTGLLVKAQHGLQRARAFYEEELGSAAAALKRDVSIDIKVKNIWGVNVPVIEQKPLVRKLEARDISPVGERAGVLEVARDFEVVADHIVRMASKEIMLNRVGEMIRADTRKINAITEVRLPHLRESIKSIERVLEEREREEVFRLKRFKARLRSREGN